MSLPGPLSHDLVSRLPRSAGGDAEPVGTSPARPTGSAALRQRLRSRARAVARRAVKTVLRPTLDRYLHRVVAPLRERDESIHVEIEQLRRRLDAEAVDRGRSVMLPGSVDATRINLELLKQEFRNLGDRIDELGWALAPATGIEGASVRVAEQREQLHAVERRLRVLDAAVTTAPRPSGDATPPTEAPGKDPAPEAPRTLRRSGPASASFNYVGFERRFRGDADEVLAVQTERYADLLLEGLPPGMPVVDIGCGRGELLAVLADRGATVCGVEPDPGMVAEARARGVRVEQTEATAFLQDAEPGSLGAVFSAHVAEHLELQDLLDLVELSARALRPGGVFVAETPNPASLIVLGNSYVLDPTHIWPLHPSLFAFLCESAGYRDVRLHFFSPAEDYHLPLLQGEDLPPWGVTVNEAFTRLNDVLFGPQEYAVIARTAPQG